MAQASQSTYVGLAQTVQRLWNAWLQIYQEVGKVNVLVTKTGAQAAWKALATAAQNADGSLGTADGTPVETHPITVSGLGMSADDTINALNDLMALAQVFDGTGGNTIMSGAIDHRGDAPSATILTS